MAYQQNRIEVSLGHFDEKQKGNHSPHFRHLTINIIETLLDGWTDGRAEGMVGWLDR